jgi:putative NADH-flavin reductase
MSSQNQRTGKATTKLNETSTKMTYQDKKALNILIVGATGATGRELMKQLFVHPSHPRVHAFCRTPQKLDALQTYHSIQNGDARNPQDLKAALEATDADVVIVSVGNGESTAKSDIRTSNAHALVSVLKEPQFEKVNAVVISSQGAGASKLKVGFGFGKLLGYHLRHVLNDHTGQENAFLQSNGVFDRIFIVRPTALTEGKKAVRIVEFGDEVKCPSIHIDRSDVARYIVDKIYSSYYTETFGGQIVNITGLNK